MRFVDIVDITLTIVLLKNIFPEIVSFLSIFSEILKMKLLR